MPPKSLEAQPPYKMGFPRKGEAFPHIKRQSRYALSCKHRLTLGFESSAIHV
jgi:hypothetical protein